MALQLSVDVRNARLDAIETEIGTSPLLRMYTGSMPANAAAASTGTLVAEMTLPSNWMNDAAAGAKALAGAWEDLSANNTGVIAYFRIFENSGTTCHLQGTITETGGGGDMEVDNDDVNAGQAITVTAFTLTDGNA
jgi:hypothetical protein